MSQGQCEAQITIDDAKTLIRNIKVFNQWLGDEYKKAHDTYANGDHYNDFKSGRYSAHLQIIIKWQELLDDTFRHNNESEENTQ